MKSDLKGIALRDYRIQLFRKAHAFERPERVPISGNMFTWMFLDAGYSLEEALYHYDKIDDSLMKFVKKYKVDAINQLHTGYRNCFPVCAALDQTGIYSTDKGLQAITEDIIHPDEYDDLINDYQKTIWTKALPRIYPNVKKMSCEAFANAAKNLKVFNNARTHSEEKLQEEHGIVVDSVPAYCPASELLFTRWRGIKGFSMDIRRHLDKVYEFSESYDEQFLPEIFKNLDRFSGQNPDQPYDVCLVMLGHTVLNEKKFEKLYVPSFKKVLDYCQKHGKQAFIYAEGSWERFGDFFNSYEKGVCNMMVEMDDPYTLRKKFPNLCLYGGLDVGVMGTETSDKCIDMAKKAIEELGRDGGLVLQPNKMVSYVGDMKSENLEAVCDFVAKYEL